MRTLEPRARANSNRVFAGLVSALIILRVLLLFLPQQGILPSQQSLLSWTAVAIVIGLGVVGRYLARQTDFPRLWDTAVSNGKRLLLPAGVGLGLGIIWIWLETSGTFGVVRATLPGNQIHTPLPAALVTYPAGALILEFSLRLFAIPLLLWLISDLLLGGRGQQVIFWLAAALVALVEPLGLAGPVLQSGAAFSMDLALLFGFSYGANLIFADLFRRYGFLAPVTARFSFYLAWHILFAGLT